MQDVKAREAWLSSSSFQDVQKYIDQQPTDIQWIPVTKKGILKGIDHLRFYYSNSVLVGKSSFQGKECITPIVLKTSCKFEMVERKGKKCL